MTQKKYDKRVHGRTSLANPATEALAEEWRMAQGMPPGPPPPGEWVPRDSVFVRADILPRADDYLDFEKVKEYAGVFRDLPPIRVQKDTFVLIDGRHRLNAAYDSAANSVCIRIVEVDVPDAELRDAAFAANIGHGVAYRPKDRIQHLRYLLVEKKDGRTDAELARACGMSRSAVMDNRHKWLGRMRDYPVERFTKPDNRSSTEPDVPQSDISASGSKRLPNNGRDLRREPLAQDWPDDDLPVRDVDEDEGWPDETADESDGSAGEEFAPPHASAPSNREGRVPLPAPPSITAARGDLELVIAWLNAMPNVGAADMMVAALRDVGEARYFAFLLAGATTLCSDLGEASRDRVLTGALE